MLRRRHGRYLIGISKISHRGRRRRGGGRAGPGRPAFGARQPGPGTQLTVASPSLIYTAGLSVRARDVTSAAARAAAIATSAGGYVSAEHAVSGRGPDHPPAVTVTLKIPVPRYQAALGQLDALGRPVSLDQHVTDVTQQVADVASRVTSERAAIAQLRLLLRRAGSVGALLGVQDQINGDESALEALQAQQRSLGHEVSYATVSLTLLSQHQPAHRHRKHAAGGFLAGLSGGWRAFRLAVGWLLTALGTVLPFAVLAAILAALGYAFRGRLRRLARLRHRGARPTVT